MYNVTEEQRVGPLSQRLRATSVIAGTDVPVGDFWSWAYSDVLSNAMRGCFGEYLVATQLGITDRPRVEWDAVDLRYEHQGETYGIEVKTSSRFQSWPLPIGKQRAEPTFGFAERRPWDYDTGVFEETPRRCADVYVFCHYLGPSRCNCNDLERRLAVLDTARWEFFVARTASLEKKLARRKAISLVAIEKLATGKTNDVKACRYNEIGPTIRSMLQSPSRLKVPTPQLEEITEARTLFSS